MNKLFSPMVLISCSIFGMHKAALTPTQESFKMAFLNCLYEGNIDVDDEIIDRVKKFIKPSNFTANVTWAFHDMALHSKSASLERQKIFSGAYQRALSQFDSERQKEIFIDWQK